MFLDKSDCLITFNIKVKKTLDSVVKIIKEHPEWNFSIEESGSKRVLHGKLPFYKTSGPPLRLELQLVNQDTAVFVKGKLFWASIFYLIQNIMSIVSMGFFSILIFAIAISAANNNMTSKIIMGILGVLIPIILFSFVSYVVKKATVDWRKEWTELYKKRFLEYLSDKDLLDT